MNEDNALRKNLLFLISVAIIASILMLLPVEIRGSIFWIVVALSLIVLIVVALRERRSRFVSTLIAQFTKTLTALGKVVANGMPRIATVFGTSVRFVAQFWSKLFRKPRLVQKVEDSSSPFLITLFRVVLAVAALVVMYVAQLGLFRNPTDNVEVLYFLLLLGLAILALLLRIFPVTPFAIDLPKVGKIRILWVWLVVATALALFAGWRVRQVGTTIPEQFIVWLLSMLVLGLAFARTENPIAETNPLKRWEWILIIGFFVAALLVRGVNIGTSPKNLDGDEAHFAVDGANSVPLGLAGSPFVTSFDSYSLVQSDLIALCVSLLGATIAAARIPSVLLGALTVPAIYLLGRELYNWKLGLAAAIFTVGWAFHAQFSRLGLNQVGDPCFGTLAFYFLIRGVRRANPLDYAISGILLAISQMFYIAGMQYPLIMIAFLLWMAWQRRDLILPQWRLILIVPLTMFIIFIPRAYFLLENQEPLFGHTQPNIFFGGFLERAIAEGNEWGFLRDQVRDSFLGLFSEGDRSSWYGFGSNLLSPVGGPLLLIGLVASLFMLKRYPLIALAPGWSFSAIFLGATLSGSPPSYQRYVAGAPAFALLVGLGTIAIGNMLAQLLTPWQPNRIFLVLCAAVGAASLAFYVGVYIPEEYLSSPPVWAGQHASFDMQSQIKAGRNVWLIDKYGSGLDQSAPVIQYLMTGLSYQAIQDNVAISDGFAKISNSQEPMTLYIAPDRMDELNTFLSQNPTFQVTSTREVDDSDNNNVPAYFEIKLN